MSVRLLEGGCDLAHVGNDIFLNCRVEQPTQKAGRFYG